MPPGPSHTRGACSPCVDPTHSSHWCSQSSPSSSGIPVWSCTRAPPLTQPGRYSCPALLDSMAPASSTAYAFPDQPSPAAALLTFLSGVFKELVKVMHQLPRKGHTMGWHCLQAVSWAPENCLGAPG